MQSDPGDGPRLAPPPTIRGAGRARRGRAEAPGAEQEPGVSQCSQRQWISASSPAAVADGRAKSGASTSG